MKFIPGWYIIYTKIRYERKVVLDMNKKEIRHLFPVTTVMKVWHDRRKLMEVPLFPSYIFVYLNSLSEYFEVEKVEGVVKFVHFGKEVARVRDSVIHNLECLLMMGQELEVSAERFQTGQQLHINYGPFAGTACEVVSHKNQRKVIVRINLLNRVVLTDVPASSLVG